MRGKIARAGDRQERQRRHGAVRGSEIGGKESEKGYKSVRYSFQCDCHSCIVNQGLYF